MNSQSLTRDTASALVASLPVPSGLTLTIVGGWIEMSGGQFGGHSLSVAASTAERVEAHWRGYCENNGHKLPAAVSAKPVRQRKRPVRPLPKAWPVQHERPIVAGEQVRFYYAPIWRTGRIERVTRTRALISFVFVGERDAAWRQGRKPHRYEVWRNFDEITRV
jgi:hypothetical protein